MTKRNTTIGSESSNAMSKEQKAQAAWGELKDKRKIFCGSRAVLVMEDQTSGVMLFEGDYAAVGKPERVWAVGFSGKRAKPDFNCIFPSKEAQQKYVAEWLARLQATAERKAERQAEAVAKRAAGHQLAVGDVLEASWGYEQTNVDYYQVTALIGRCMVEVREIGRQAEQTGYLQGDCVPAKNQFKGEPMRRRVCDDGRSIKVESWGIWARKIEPKKVGGMEVYPVSSYSSYA